MLRAAPSKFLVKKIAAEKESKCTDSATITGEEDTSKPSVDWSTRAKDFDMFPRQDEGRRPSNWWLIFYAVRLSSRKGFHLAIVLWTKLREVVTPLPIGTTAGSVNPNASNQVLRPSMK